MITTNEKFSILNILFFFLSITFIIGAAVVETAFLLLSLLIFIKYKNEIFDKEFKNIIIFFLLFYLYLNFNSLFAVNKFQAFKSSIPYIRYLFIFLTLVYFLQKNIFILQQKKYLYYLLISILFFDASIQYYFGKNILGLPLIDPNSLRVSSFFGSELILGGYISKIFPIILSLVFFFQDKLKKKIGYELLVLCLLVLITGFYAGERVAIFHIILTLFYVLFFLNNNKNIKKLFIIFFVTISSYLFLTDNITKQRLIDHTLASFKVRDIDSKLDNKILIYSQSHHSHIVSAYKMFLDKPIIGNGLKGFRNLCNDKNYKINNYSCTTHPHNTIMLFLSELGIIGLIFYLISFIYFFKNFLFFFNKTHIPYVKSIQSLCTGILFFYLPIPTGAFFNNFYSYQFYFLISFYFLFLKLYNDSDKKI